MKQNSPFFGCGAFIKKLKYYNVVCGMEKTKTKEIVLCNSCKSLDNKDSAKLCGCKGLFNCCEECCTCKPSHNQKAKCVHDWFKTSPNYLECRKCGKYATKKIEVVGG